MSEGMAFRLRSQHPEKTDTSARGGGRWRGGPVDRALEVKVHPKLARRRPRPYVPRTLKFVTSLLM